MLPSSWAGAPELHSAKLGRVVMEASMMETAFGASVLRAVAGRRS